MLSNLVVRHDPVIMFAPAGGLAPTRMSSPLPVTGAPLVLLLSVKSKVIVLPSGETFIVDVPTTLPFFLSVSCTSLSLTTLTATVSKYGCPVTFWSVPSALTSIGGTHDLHSYIPFS